MQTSYDVAFAVLTLLAIAPGCTPRETAQKSASATVAPAARRMTAADLLSQPADVEVTLNPPAVVRDRVYGPLLRRASALAAAYAGPRTLGTTALAALERTEEVDVATDDAGEAVVLLRGVPAELDVSRVVDENGQPVWKGVVGDVRQSVVEYAPTNGSLASLFVLPQRIWVVAAGPAEARTREALVGAPGGVSFAPGEVTLAKLSIRGGALVRRVERLRSGSLAALGNSLLRASFELAPGAEGVIVGKFDYANGGAALDAQQTVQEVVGAFRRRLEQIETKKDSSPAVVAPPLAWLAAAGVERANNTVSVRAPIPKAWLDAIALADVPTGGVSGTPSDVPWGLWRHSTPSPTLSLPH
jgi:hypothetical protein